MRYYIKRAETNEVSGPFEIEELNRRICDQLITSEWLATSDLGESIERLRQSSAKDWSWIAEVPGVIGIERPKHQSRRNLSVLRQVALIVLIVAGLFIGFFVCLRIWLGDIH